MLGFLSLSGDFSGPDGLDGDADDCGRVTSYPELGRPEFGRAGVASSPPGLGLAEVGRTEVAPSPPGLWLGSSPDVGLSGFSVRSAVIFVLSWTSR